MSKNGAEALPQEASARQSLSVRVLLLLVVLIPTGGMILMASVAASRAASERDDAARLEQSVARLEAIIDARAAIADEEVLSSVIAIAADLGVGAAEVGELYGVDYVAELAAARAEVDADGMLGREAAVAESVAELRSVRAALDAGTAGFAELSPVIGTVRANLDLVWSQEYGRQAGTDGSGRLLALTHRYLDALNDAYLALAAGSERATHAIHLLSGSAITEEGRAALLDASARYDAAVASLASHLGPRAATAWQAHTTDPAGQRFESTLEDAERLAISGAPSPLAADPEALGDALIDGDPWSVGLTETVRAAAADLATASRAQASDAARDLRLLLVGALLLTLATLGGAVLIARVVTRPVRRLEEAARQIRGGRFDLEPLVVSGPRELADTASAFNEMATTLAAVEAHAVALTDDPDAPVLADELPGRTGRALQVALNRLRSSIQAAERHRRELQQAATHDDLTGLLNRPAALEVVERDISRVERDGGVVVALFIDLDGLKAINDAHGHAAGDDALRLVADALRSSTRAADVVARLSGDEFLVAGVAHDLPAEIEALAERVHAAIGAQVLECDGSRMHLRASVGVAVAAPSDSVHTLVNRADEALYTAKRHGRNRIAWHPETRAVLPQD